MLKDNTHDQLILGAYHYVVYNIHGTGYPGSNSGDDYFAAVNWFFTSWHGSLQTAYAYSSSQIASIVEVVDPIRKTNVALNDIVLATTFGLAFVGGPFGSVTDSSTQAIGGFLITLVQQAPTVAKALWPVGTADSQLYQISELESLNANIAQRLDESLSRGLREVLGNLDTFINFTIHVNPRAAPFSVPSNERPSVANQTEGLLTALFTFLISSALVENGWNGAVVPGVDPQSITTNKSAVLPDWALYDCSRCSEQTDMGCEIYDSNNMCGRWWYNPDIECAFTLGGHISDQDPGHLMSQIFSRNWTAPELLFKTSALCDGYAATVDGNMTISIPHDLEVGPPDYTSGDAYRMFLSYPEAWVTWANDTIRGRTLSNLSVEVESHVTFPRDQIFTWPHGNTQHPNSTLLNYTSGGADFSCTSQLSLTIMDTWYDVINGIIP